MVCFKARQHFQNSVSFFWVRSTGYCDFIFYLFGKYGSCLFNYALPALEKTSNPLILHFFGAYRHAKHAIPFKNARMEKLKNTSVKSRGDLKTSQIGLAHSPIHFFCKALFWCEKSLFMPVCTKIMQKQWVLCSHINLQYKTCQINLTAIKLSKNNYPNKVHTFKEYTSVYTTAH